MSILLWIAGAFIALKVIVFAVVVYTYARLRLQAHAFTQASLEAIPEPLRPLFERAAGELEALGFEAQGFALLSPVLEGDAAPTPTLLLSHRDGRCWALVVPSAAPSQAAPLDLQLVSHFADESSLVTLSGQKFTLPCDVPRQRVVDNYRLRWDELVRDHQEALASCPAAPLALALEELLERSNYGAVGALSSLERLVPGDATSPFVLPWAQVFKVAARVLVAADRFQRLQRERLNAPAWAPDLPEAQLWVEARVLCTTELIRSFPMRRSLLWASFALTGALFAVSMALYGSLTFIVQITCVVLVHELGHWLAMRATGYRQPSIFFIPFFGAATAGHKPDASLWQELFVLLAGPLPGILLAGLALTVFGPLPEPLHELAKLAIVVNAANLLPFWPLDGGRIVHRLMLRDRPKLELAMTLVSAGLFALLAFAVSDPLLAIPTVSLLLSAKTSFRVGRYAERLRRIGPVPGADPLISALRITADRPEAFAQRALVVRGVLERLRTPDSSLLQRGLGSAGYAGVVVFTLALMGRTLDSDGLEEHSIECAGVLEGGDRALAGVSDRAFGMHCQPSAQQAIEPLLGQLSEAADLPRGLCLQGAWAGAGLSEQQLRARRNVRELELASRSITLEEDEPTPEQVAKLEARIAAAVEAKLEERRPLADFDAAASAAYLSYQRAGWPRAAEARALEELLGRAPTCPPSMRVFHADVGARGELAVASAGDPRPLIQHFCKAGCRSVSWSTPY